MQGLDTGYDKNKIIIQYSLFSLLQFSVNILLFLSVGGTWGTAYSTSVAGEDSAQPFLPSIIRIMRDLL